MSAAPDGAMRSSSGAALRIETVLLALLGLAANTGCVQKSYHIKQAAMMSALAPRPPSRFDSTADLYAGGGVATGAEGPRASNDDQPSAFVAKSHVDAAGGFRLTRRTRLRLDFRHSFGAAAYRATKVELAELDDNPWAAGVGFEVRIGGFGDPVALDVGVDTMFGSLPVWLDVTCHAHTDGHLIDPESAPPCDEYDTFRGVKRELYVSWEAIARLSFELGQGARFFGGASIVTFPTVAETTYATDDDIPNGRAATPEVDIMNFGLLLSAGIELSAGPVSVIPAVAVPLLTGDLRLDPVLTLGVRGRFGGDEP